MFNILDLVIFPMCSHKANKHPVPNIIHKYYDSVNIFVTMAKENKAGPEKTGNREECIRPHCCPTYASFPRKRESMGLSIYTNQELTGYPLSRV